MSINPYDEDVLDNYSLEQDMEMLAQEEGYVEVPPDVEKYIEDPYYLGTWIGGVHEWGDYAGLPRLHPCFRESLYDIYPNPFTSPYEEINVTGAIGIGKTTLALCGISYDLMRLLLLENPQGKYGLARTTVVATALFSATRSLGGVVLWAQLQEIFQTCPFFQKLYSPKPNHPEVLFPKNIGVINGSQYKDALGTAIIQGVLDEANFQTMRVNQALLNYNNITRRMTSRYAGVGGNLPCRMWVISSKDDNSSFLEEHINKNRNNPKVKIIELALYEVLEYRGIYSGKKFPVFIGDSNKDPAILPVGQPLPNSMDPSRVIEVPVEYKQKFEDDLLGALRDIAGKSTASRMKLFRSIEQINKSLYASPRAFTQDVIQLDMKEEGNQIKDFLDEGFWNMVIMSKDIPHFIHMDFGLTQDLFGIAMCHVSGTKEIQRLDPMTGKIQALQELIILHDFVVGIRAMPGMEVPFWKVLEFLVYLRSLGFNLGSINADNLSRTSNYTYDKRTGGSLITADGYNSRDMLQRLQKQGFEAGLLSVDITKDPYLSFKRGLVEDRVMVPRNQRLIQEMLSVEVGAKKVDHPLKNADGTPGSKDLLDSVVGSFWSCQENAHSSQLYSDRTISQMQSELDSGEFLWNKKYGSFQAGSGRNNF